MKEIAKFQMGSEIFFRDYPDFKSKDSDWLYVMDKWDIKSPVLNIKKDGRDLFFVGNFSKDKMIEDTLNSKVPMRACKFLVPDYLRYLGMTVEDFKRLQPCFDNIDEKHIYTKMIFDAYIENNDFFLTEAQKEDIYKEYLKERSTNE